MENEIYVILRKKQRDYDNEAIAASRNVNWVTRVMNKLPGDIRENCTVRPVQVNDVEQDLVVFYDRWAPGEPLSLSGFGVDSKQRPALPIEPEERHFEELVLDQEPAHLLPKRKEAAAKPKPKPAEPVKQTEEPAQEPPRKKRRIMALGLAFGAWVFLLAVILAAAQMKPTVLEIDARLPDGLQFPFSYEAPKFIEHAGWLYFESGLTRSAFKRAHDTIPWMVIAQDETMNVVNPAVFDLKSHERGGFSFASGLGDVDRWRQEHFIVINDGYFATWSDGSKLVYDVSSDRIYGRVRVEVARELFGR
ncbi:hypothetical protein [Cerasicoccus fimbriatus]|uniref:hypothetical protein n=1 Tax=Cerasicoccus fimbriatus TaxID=3014554 RepID=UPI0022B33366|nr:hypothetical protein [Cerasicoccus sp. TK19100]